MICPASNDTPSAIVFVTEQPNLKVAGSMSTQRPSFPPTWAFGALAKNSGSDHTYRSPGLNPDGPVSTKLLIAVARLIRLRTSGLLLLRWPL